MEDDLQKSSIDRVVSNENLLLTIFSLIESKADRDACSLVNKLWCKMEGQGRQTISICTNAIPPGATTCLIRRFPNIRSLRVEQCLEDFPSMRSTTLILPLPPVHNHHPYPPAKVPYCTLHGNGPNCASGCRLEMSYLSDSMLQAFGEGFKTLESLTLSWCKNVTDPGLISSSKKFRALKSLTFQACHIGDEGLSALGEACEHVENLNLRDCIGFTDGGMIKFAYHRKLNLKSLSITGCNRITDTAMHAISTHCKSVENLSVMNSTTIGTSLRFVARECPLKVLELQCQMMTDFELEVVGRYCPSLKSFTLYGAIHDRVQNITNRSLCTIARGCPRIKTLRLIHCKFLDDDVLHHFANYCSGLTHIKVNGCPNIRSDGFKSIGKYCARLSELALFHFDEMESDALAEIGKGCKFLETLILENCLGLGDASICSIARGCRNLRKLVVAQCHTLGDEGITAVGQNCNFLTDLCLKFCYGMGDEAMIAVGEGCPSLQHLNLRGCHRIGDAGITAVARGCPQLTSLDASGFLKFGDQAMMELGDGCPLLKGVVISNSNHVTHIGLLHLTNRCTLLEKCCIDNCPQIMPSGATAVARTCSKRMKRLVVDKFQVHARTKRIGGPIIQIVGDSDDEDHVND